jgi:hypothetical protein
LNFLAIVSPETFTVTPLMDTTLNAGTVSTGMVLGSALSEPGGVAELRAAEADVLRWLPIHVRISRVWLMTGHTTGQATDHLGEYAKNIRSAFACAGGQTDARVGEWLRSSITSWCSPRRITPPTITSPR